MNALSLRSDIDFDAPKPSPPPLSALHAMLGEVALEVDAEWLNTLCNDPSIYPLVKGFDDRPIDLSAVVANPANVCLRGEHGAVLFTRMQPGLYEVHVQVLPSGYGPWARAFIRACLHWMFTRSDAVEVWARCPHQAGRRLAEDIGATYEFTNRTGWIMDGAYVPAEVYRLTVQDWLRDAPGLEERGGWFQARLASEYVRHGRKPPASTDDPAVLRHTGAAMEMLMGGQANKAAILYARFAAMSGRAPIMVTSYHPTTVDLGEALIVVRPDDFWVALVRPGAN